MYPFDTVGLAYLGTVRKDGGPRMHPMCPVIADGNLYALIEPGPKRFDLQRDGRYALYAFPSRNDNEDAFYITGVARDATDKRSAVSAVFWKERGRDDEPAEAVHSTCFELLIGMAMLTRTNGYGDWNPQHTIWRSR